MVRRLRPVLLHPLGIGLALGSAALAGLMVELPYLAPWSDRAPWVLVDGLAAYAACAAVVWASRPSPAEAPAAGSASPPPAKPAARRVPAPGPYPNGLTRREVEVLCLLAEGNTNKEIARRLTIATPSVEAHVAHIYTKTGAHNRAAAATYASLHGLCRAGPEPDAPSVAPT